MSFQSTPTSNNNNNNNNASRIAENSTPTYVTTSQVAMAVSSVTQQQRPLQIQPINANGHIIIPPLLPNSALYQYNEQMIHMHELYEDHHHNNHHRAQPEATGRSTDV